MSNQQSESRPPTGAQAIAQIQASLASMVASERRVAEVVLSNPKEVINSTASAIAARAVTSATTVIRFARTAGFSGYQELAIALAISEPELDEGAPNLKSTDSAAETLQSVINLGARAVAGSASAINFEAFEAAVAAVAAARHVLCVGAALTAPVAEDLAYRLNHMGIAADAPADHQIQRIRAGHVGPDDVCIAFLHGGTYPHIVQVAQDAQDNGATVIALTSFVRTPLADLADIALVVGATSVATGIEAWTSRLQFLTIVDALTIAVTNTNPELYRGSLSRISNLIEQDLL